MRLTSSIPRHNPPTEHLIASVHRSLYDARAGGFYGSQTADPDYYRLAPTERRAARKPPVNRDKVTARNAEAALTFLALGQSTGRKDLVDVALSTLDFMGQHLITDKAAFQLYDVKTRRAQ